ncbi:MAG TPA: divergent PAP2 family protein [Spirochaetota bacterium]|nr:divergent PAP2 family protein [Spirochaetota bacterium]
MDIAANFNMLLGQILGMFYHSFLNRLLILACSAQIMSMFAKGIVNFIVTKKFDAKKFFHYGGMPSSHTVFIMSFVFGIGLDKNYGFGHPLFTFGIIVSALVLMDAVRLRGVIDKLNIILSDIINNNPLLKEKYSMPKIIAHKPSEIIGGIFFALIYTFLFYLFFYGVFK